jgi:WXG100 family type VII secretion target
MGEGPRVADTTAQAAVMEKAASQFEDGNAQMQQMLTSLLAELSALQQAWRGSGGTAFEQVKQRWEEDQRKLQQALTETANAIRTAGRVYTSTDSSAADRVGATHSGGHQLPL